MIRLLLWLALAGLYATAITSFGWMAFAAFVLAIFLGTALVLHRLGLLRELFR